MVLPFAYSFIHKSVDMKVTFLIFFFSLLFFSYPTFSLAQDKIIEAEHGQLLGAVNVVNSTLCSEGRKIGNIGNSTGNNVVFHIDLNENQNYNVLIFYLTENDRQLEVTVNNQQAVNVTCPATGSFDTPGVVNLELNLSSGSNSIKLGNSENVAPDIDMLIFQQIVRNDSTNIKSFTIDNWEIKINLANGETDYIFNQSPVITKSQAAFKESSDFYSGNQMKDFSVSQTTISDSLGAGSCIIINSKSFDNKIIRKQYIYVYPGKNYILTDFTIESNEELTSNYLAPVYSNSETTILPSGQNQSLWVPFDNDKWVRYHTLNFGVPLNSYEVCAFINNTSRKGVVAGSVEHDVWKTGIRAVTNTQNAVNRLEIFGGVSSNETRDNKEHGAVKGNQIKSPKIFIGTFNDWRLGLETYASVNKIIAPGLTWSKGKPFGWNSWGAIQTNLSYTNASEVSQYFAENLQNNNFHNDSTVYIGLDSYWDNITYSNLLKFVRECKNRGQNAGIYWTPFVDWANNPDRPVEGAEGYLYRDIYLYANGKTQKIAGANAIDPTHPATKLRANLYLDRFIQQGFTFLKLDFMTHGALESDSHFNPEVHTGIQAYNEGLKYIIDYLDNRMFINFSISPLFPTNYAHSRRIACDAYSSINDTEYTLNSLSYGWWLDHIYSFNDGDNVVLNGVSLGENRARVTSSVITGIFIVGDNFSTSGYNSAKLRAQEFLTNAEVNRVARNAKAFFPVETSPGDSAANMFIQTIGDTLYLAVFNYQAKSEYTTINFDRLPLDKQTNYTFHELWSNTTEQHADSWEILVPRRDVKFFKIYKAGLVNAKDIKSQAPFKLYPNPCNENLFITNPYNNEIDCKVFNSLGTLVKTFTRETNKFYVGDLPQGLYLFVLNTNNKEKFSYKILKN